MVSDWPENKLIELSIISHELNYVPGESPFTPFASPSLENLDE